MNNPITHIVVENTGAEQQNVPFTIGQVFSAGHLPKGAGLQGILSDGSTLPVQVDAKAFHPDGSVRHAILSCNIPSLVTGDKINLVQVDALTYPEIAWTKVDAVVTVVIAGETYTASADELLAKNFSTWLRGPIANELHVSSPLAKADGTQHPHLAARFALRQYQGNTRVDFTAENNWAYEPSPQNFNYDVTLTVNGAVVYNNPTLVHLHHSRWREAYWTNGEPAVHIKHNLAYLIATKAIPNYDQSVKVSETTLQAWANKYAASSTKPMGIGLANDSMPAQGGRIDIGIIPGWYLLYLLSMDKRAKDFTLGTATRAGSWTMHYRDKNTDMPVSLMDYPYMTILGNPGDTGNPKAIDPVTKKRRYEAFPEIPKGTYQSGHDTAHQPGFSYVPYLVTGDYYHLEELQFWAMYNALACNPGYRKNIEGLVWPHQVRGQAWSLRSLGQAAYITPDSHPLKRHFNAIVQSNLAKYTAEYVNNPSVNKLGAVTHANAVVYGVDNLETPDVVEKKNAIGVFQDDHFTSVFGHLAELGFKDAEPMLKHKIKFPIGRLTAEGVNWQAACTYEWALHGGAAHYETFAESFRATVGPVAAAVWNDDAAFAKARGKPMGDLGGYSELTTGFPSNLQPAVAFAADFGGEGGKEAWKKFMSRTVKPNYGAGAQFAVIPRSAVE